jgi:hypothetical protein
MISPDKEKPGRNAAVGRLLRIQGQPDCEPEHDSFGIPVFVVYIPHQIYHGLLIFLFFFRLWVWLWQFPVVGTKHLVVHHCPSS